MKGYGYTMVIYEKPTIFILHENSQGNTLLRFKRSYLNESGNTIIFIHKFNFYRNSKTII